MEPAKVHASAGGGTVVFRPPASCVCVVMVCDDMSEADHVSRRLSELNTCCLVTYRRLQDFTSGVPAGKVALVILATNDESAVVGRTLHWLRNRWPRCPVAVVGDTGGGSAEMTARQGGACYLVRPVDPEHWSALLSHAIGGQARQIKS